MLIGILYIVLLAIISYGFGRFLLYLLKVPFRDSWEELIFSIGIGLGLLSLGILILGLFKLLYLSVFVGFLILGLTISFPYLKALFKKLIHHKFNWINLTFFVLMIFVIGFEFALLDWSPLDFDELNYHLALPATYLRSHAITVIPYNMFSNFPLNIEMLFMPALALKSTFACRSVSLLFLALCGITIFAMTKRYFNAKAALFSSAIFLGLPNVIRHSILAYNDFGLVFFILLSIYALLNWERDNNDLWLVLSGAFCGLSIGVKYSGGINFAFLALYIFFSRRNLKPLTYFLGSGLILILPWLLKNIAFVNNPVYPFLYSIFGGKYWSAFNMERYLRIMSGYGPKNLFALPWYLIGEWKTDFPLGPVPFVILPFVLFLRGVDRRIKYFLAYAVLYFFIWLRLSPTIRFLLPPTALLCIIGGYTIDKYYGRSKILYNLFLLFIAGFLFYYSWMIGSGIIQGSPYVKDQLKGYFQIAAYVNKDLPPFSKILFIGEPRTFGFEKEIITSSMFDTAVITEIIESSENSQEIAQKLKQKGITHILVNEVRMVWLKTYFNYFNWEDSSQETLFEKFLKSRHLKPVKKINVTTIYKISE